MKDEEYLYKEDCREKKNVANSARHRRTHCGKGGRVKFPSDYMTRKELEAMNGEVKSYKLNDPMKWNEFKMLPDDIKIMYIKLLRQKFNVPAIHIAKMLGVSGWSVSKEFGRLGISEGKTRGKCTVWDKDGFYAWCNGTTIPNAADHTEEAPEADEQPEEEQKEETAENIREPEPVPVFDTPTDPKVKAVSIHKERAIPDTGTMTFEGSAESIMNTLSMLLSGADVHISITWDVLSRGCD